MPQKKLSQRLMIKGQKAQLGCIKCIAYVRIYSGKESKERCRSLQGGFTPSATEEGNEIPPLQQVLCLWARCMHQKSA